MLRRPFPINDHDFKINILSLNAAVQAAKAKKHDKGFDVVTAGIMTVEGGSKIAATYLVQQINLSIELTQEATSYID